MFLVQDVEIRDRLAQSQINKFLYQYTSEACPKQTHANMVRNPIIIFLSVCSLIERNQSVRKTTPSYISKPIKSLTRFLNFRLTKIDHLTLKMASAQVVETSVADNSPSQDSSHPDGHFNQGVLLLGSNHVLIIRLCFRFCSRCCTFALMLVLKHRSVT